MRVVAPWLVLLSLGVCGAPARAAYVIVTADLDGRGPETIAEVPAIITGMALDAVNGRLYLADQGSHPVSGRILRINTDGTDLAELVLGIESPGGIAVDLDQGHLYWTVAGGEHLIQRSNLDGTNVVTILNTVELPTDIALDLQQGKMYWTGAFKVKRANLNGSGVQVLYEKPVAFFLGLALDLTAGKMYFGDFGTIKRANLDGTDLEDLGVGDPIGLALDVPGGKLYWTDIEVDRVERSNLDGTNEETILPIPNPHKIVIDSPGGKLYVAASLPEAVPAGRPATWAFLLAVMLGLSTFLVSRTCSRLR